MSNESNPENPSVQTVETADLKASDFFPPGEGWNQADGEAKPDRDAPTGTAPLTPQH